MNRFHFVHTAGLRLNQPFEGIGRVPSEILEVLADATAAAWRELVDTCIEKRVEFLVVAGGLEAPGDGLAGRLSLSAGLKQLAEHGVQCFLSLGPDDANATEFLSANLGDAITVFPGDRPETVLVERRDRVIAAVCGQSSSEDGEVDYRSFFAEAPEDVVRIGVVPGTTADLERGLADGGPRASYWALGDAPEASRSGFSPWIVESGSLQGRSPAAGERGAHGAMLVEVESGRVLAVDQIAVDRVRFAEIAITPRFATDDALLCHQIMDELNRLRATHSGRALLVDIVFAASDRHPVPPFSSEQTAEILERLRNDTRKWDPFVWCADLRVVNAQPDDPIGDDLAQAIVQESRALLANPLQRSYYFARRFEPLMKRWTSELDTDDAERLIADATSLALQSAGASMTDGE